MVFVEERVKRARLGLGLLPVMALVVATWSAVPANAGTYPMYQCAAGHPNVASGWSVYGFDTNASTVLQNSCSGGGAIEDYVFSHGETGAVEENGHEGSQVGISLNVPGSAPDVSIDAISAKVLVSPVSGDDAFLGFSAGGQGLLGAAEIHNGAGGYNASNNWTNLPQGTRDFETYVNCSTDGSNTNCHFSESTHVPALQDITLTLIDNTPPSLSAVSGTLPTAAAHGSTVSGSQTIGYTGKDADSGMLSSSIKLTPQGSGSGYERKVEFAKDCTYESWNACPLSENVSPLSVPTATLNDGTYAVTLTLTDAAGNLASESLGTITTHNAPALSSSPAISGTATVGQTLSATPGQVSSNPEAGTLKTTGQWQLCDSAGNNCTAISGATGTSYNLTSSDEGHMLRYQETVSNNDGSTSAQSASYGPVTPSAAELEKAEKEKVEREKIEREKVEREKGSSGTNGTNGSPGAGGSGGSGTGSSVTVDLAGSGASQGAVLLGSAASWVVSLKVSPLKVRRHSKIKLAGLVSTAPRPSSGKLIYLQARSVGSAMRGRGSKRHRVTVYGKWVTFQAFRAKSDGSFSSSYTFKLGGKHTYQFQAIAPAEGQYRNPTGTSKTITVREV